MKRSISALLACIAFVISSQAMAETPKNVAEVVPLPISGVVMAKKNGIIKIASQNGRFEFKGALHDRWSNREVLTLNDARRAFNYVEFDALNLDMSRELQPYKLGSGDKNVMIFIDPYCAACAALLDTLPRDSKEYTFNIVIIGVLGDQSIARMKNLTCAKDQKAAFQQILNKKYKDLDVVENCSIDLTTRRMMTAQILGIKGIPYLIRQDGLISRGAPQLGIEAWLNG